MIDAPGAIRNYLLTLSNLTALVGTRVYPETDVLPPGRKPSDGPAICFLIRGGTLRNDDSIVLPSVQFTCWAAASDDESAEYRCQELYRTLVDAIDGQGGATARHGWLEVLGQTLHHPDSGWPFVLCDFRMALANS
jgi:hypothetical protein